MRPLKMLFAGLVLGVGVASASAQAPIVNAVVKHRPATTSVARDVQTIAQEGIPAWIGYKVPIIASRGTQLRDTGNCCGRCRLEPATDLIVLARVADRELVELRTEAVDCDIDAAGCRCSGSTASSRRTASPGCRP